MKNKVHKGIGTSAQGFTLIETLVAISILMIAVVIPLSIVANALQSSYYARDQITAAYLAQDALEYVRSLRDSDVVAINNNHAPIQSWYSSLDPSCTNGTGCDVGTIDAGANKSTGAVAGPLKYEKSKGLYHASWASAGSTDRFTRTVRVSQSQINSGEYFVDVIVQWTGSGAGNKTVEVSESLFNVWQ